MKMTAFFLLITGAACFAQAPRPFDVASVKLNNSGGGGVSMRTKNGLLTATNAPVLMLVQQAFQVKDFQVSGGPGWLATERYDIEGKIEKNDISDDDLWLSLQPLLIDRFHLKFHRETKQAPVFALTVMKGGPKFTLHKESAEGNDQPRIGVSIGSGKGKLMATKTTIARFCDSLGHQVDRIVIDRTGLKGDYDLTFEWSPENHEGSTLGAPEEKAGMTGANIFEALQDQLGLKLDSVKGPVDMVVIDSVDRPSEN
jgi:uncharacterized protein (TIGR03435 family)